MRRRPRLRPYQTEMVERVRRSLREGHSPLFQMPTGAGKTETAVELATPYKRVLFVTSRATLVRQTRDRFAAYGWKSASSKGWQTGSRWMDNTEVIVATATAAANRLWDRPRRNAPGLVIIDEAHHAGTKDGRGEANDYVQVAVRARMAGCDVVGMTATPFRTSEDEGLDRAFTDLIAGPTYAELANSGYLAPIDIKRLPGGGIEGDDESLSLQHDYTERGIMQANDHETLVTRPVAWLLDESKHGERQSIVFAVTREHAADVANELASQGVPTALTLSDTSDLELNDEIIEAGGEPAVEAFRQGHARALVSVMIPTEGFDAPAAEIALMLRPTLSKTLWMQMAGRVSRPSNEGECSEATILDAAGNTARHGRPDEYDPEGFALDSQHSREVRVASPGEQNEARQKRAAEEVRAAQLNSLMDQITQKMSELNGLRDLLAELK